MARRSSQKTQTIARPTRVLLYATTQMCEIGLLQSPFASYNRHFLSSHSLLNLLADRWLLLQLKVPRSRAAFGMALLEIESTKASAAQVIEVDKYVIYLVLVLRGQPERLNLYLLDKANFDNSIHREPQIGDFGPCVLPNP